jgi:hypothetical protein
LFWDGNASIHWNQAANQIAAANRLSMSDANRLLAVLNTAMADTAFTTWGGKRFYRSVPSDVTWRPVTAILLADADGNPDTAPDPDWLPLINTPKSERLALCSSELAEQNGRARTVETGMPRRVLGMLLLMSRQIGWWRGCGTYRGRDTFVDPRRFCDHFGRTSNVARGNAPNPTPSFWYCF